MVAVEAVAVDLLGLQLKKAVKSHWFGLLKVWTVVVLMCLLVNLTENLPGYSKSNQLKFLLKKIGISVAVERSIHLDSKHRISYRNGLRGIVSKLLTIQELYLPAI